MKKLVLLLVCCSIFAYALALGIEVGNYTTPTTFWGKSCCKTTQVITHPEPEHAGWSSITEEVNKCCDYRFWFPQNCTFVGTGVILSEQ